MELIKVLQSSGTVQEDTLVMAAAKGPSLLREVMQMYEHHKASPAARSGIHTLLQHIGHASGTRHGLHLAQEPARYASLD